MAKAKKDDVIKVSYPDIRGAEFTIEGTAPLVLNRFSQKAKEALDKPTSEKRKKVIRTAESIEAAKREAFEGARYRCEGWDGIQAGAFRNALISACRLTGIPMTRAKLSVFVEPDGFDDLEGLPLVKLIADEPELYDHVGRVSGPGRAPKPTYRPMYRKWGAVLRIQHDYEQIDTDSIANLLLRAGMQVGVGEGRPDSRQSNGLGFGTFKIVS